MGPIDFIKRRAGALVLIAVGLYSLIYAVAFVQLYFLEHPYRLASRWFFDNVPAGSRIVGPHWDDRVPVTLPGPGHNVSMYIMEGRDNELPVYERDQPNIIDQLARKFAGADYIAFATPRAIDSIPRIPEEYPNTTAMLRLLWGEKLGFKLVHTTKNRPSFLGFTYNDDLADESFSVYDHPKVVVFQNMERLSKDEILLRIGQVASYEPLPTMNEMLLMDRGGWQPGPVLWRAEWGAMLVCLLVLQIVGVSAWILVGGVLRNLPELGFGLTAVLGVALAAALAWGLATVGLVPFTRAGGLFVLLLLVAGAAGRVILSGVARARLVNALSHHALYVTAAFICSSALMVVILVADRDFFVIGQRIESEYLNYLARTNEVVPWDFMNPGRVISPDLVDRFILAWFLKLSGVPLAFFAPASFILLGGILGSVFYSGCRLIFKKGAVALLVALLVVVPAAYGLQLARSATKKDLEAKLNAPINSQAQQLKAWVTNNISGTPLVIEACDDPAVYGLAAAVGLPKYAGDHEAGSSDGVVDQSSRLCLLTDPEVVFSRMMALGIELFLVPSTGSGDVGRLRVERFSNRSDLFTTVYDDGNFAVFVPAFSGYYRGAVAN